MRVKFGETIKREEIAAVCDQVRRGGKEAHEREDEAGGAEFLASWIYFSFSRARWLELLFRDVEIPSVRGQGAELTKHFFFAFFTCSLLLLLLLCFARECVVAFLQALVCTVLVCEISLA